MKHPPKCLSVPGQAGHFLVIFPTIWYLQHFLCLQEHGITFLRCSLAFRFFFFTLLVSDPVPFFFSFLILLLMIVDFCICFFNFHIFHFFLKTSLFGASHKPKSTMCYRFFSFSISHHFFKHISILNFS